MSRHITDYKHYPNDFPRKTDVVVIEFKEPSNIRINK
jgi:hypothetical protein